MPDSRTESLRYKSVNVPDLAFPPREGGYSKGHQTREDILRAALALLVDEGYAAMTMRRVATACDMKLGNLTYHFPTREDLLRELLEAVISAYENSFEEFIQMDTVPPEERLAEICGLILEDIRTKKTTRVFPELWALSNHDTFVFERVQELYARARISLMNIIQEMRPDLEAETVEELALFISASMEGATIFAGFEKPFEPRMANYERIAIRAFIDIVRNFEA